METARCSCGETYPVGADYCPNCGRPLTDEAMAADRASNAFPARREEAEAKEAGQPVRIGFGDPYAIRACYWWAALAAILTSLPLFGLLCWVWYPAAGFLSVFSYRRRTNRSVAPGGGAKLGWIAGVISFTLSLILGAAASLLGDGFGPTLERMRTQFEESGQPQLAETVERLANEPMMLAGVVVFGLLLTFVFTTGLTTLGGALGARAARDD